MKTDDLIEALPGTALVREGLMDCKTGRCTIPACLISIVRSRFYQAGLIAHPVGEPAIEPELQLYRLLRHQGGDAYSRYNSLLRELVSYEQALDVRRSRLRKVGGGNPPS